MAKRKHEGDAYSSQPPQDGVAPAASAVGRDRGLLRQLIAEHGPEQGRRLYAIEFCNDPHKRKVLEAAAEAHAEAVERDRAEMEARGRQLAEIERQQLLAAEHRQKADKAEKHAKQLQESAS